MDCVLPPSKRVKRSSGSCESDENWARHRNSLAAEDMLNVGVGHLISDSQKATPWDENHPDFISLHKDSTHLTPEKMEKRIALLQATLSKNTLQKLTMGEWDSLLSPKCIQVSTDNTNHFESLSDEVLLNIFHWLPRTALKNVALVCHRWRRLVADESLWTRMDVSSRYLPPGALGQLLSRQALILRLSQSEVAYPPILPGVKAAKSEFRSRLMYLDMSMATVSVECLAMVFLKCHRLKKLSLENVIVNDNVFGALAQNAELEVLNLAMAEGITHDGLKRLLKSCKKLRELNLAWTHLNNLCTEYVCSHLPSTMDRLNLSGCKKTLSDHDIKSLVAKCPSLRELDLSDCTGLTGNAIDHISTFKDLNFLALSRCYFVPCHSLGNLKRLQSLTYLDIHGGYINQDEQAALQATLGHSVQINKFKFSSIARPAVGQRKYTIWGLKMRY